MINPVCMLFTSAAIAGGDTGEFIPLGDVPGGAFASIAYNVSADGKAVTGYATDASGGVGFRWTAETGIQPLDSIALGAGAEGWGIGAASNGTIFAASATTPAGFELVVWTPVTGLVNLGDMPGGEVYASVADMSADGRYIIGETGLSPTQWEPFRWSLDTGFVGLGFLPGGEVTAVGQSGGCNEDGSIIVGSSSSTDGTQAFRWIDGSLVPMVGLGELPGGSYYSHAWSTSDDGSVVVGLSESAAGFEAFRWTDDGGGMVSLGDLPGAPHGSQANDTSADGSIVVGFGNSGIGFPTDAFIWTAVDGMQKFQDVLINEHGLGPELTGWHLDGLAAVTPDGRTFVGWGTNPTGDVEAFLARFRPLDPADVNGDGIVNILDLLSVLANWG